MAGTTVPNLLILVLLALSSIGRFVYKLPFPWEEILVFPMALVPNLFGVWNILYVALGAERRLPIGVHGALLPFIIAPTFLAVAKSLGLLSFGSAELILFEAVRLPYAVGLAIFPIGIAAYYLVWKHIISFLNSVLGIA
jgi:hypothetical protein